MTAYTVPTDPADPEHAALELIVRLPADILDSTAFTTVLQQYCSLLHAQGCFTGLCWPDAKAVAPPCPSTSPTATMRPTSCVTGPATFSPGPTA